MDHDLSTEAMEKRLRMIECLYLELLEYLDAGDRQEYLRNYYAIWDDFHRGFEEE